ncbi:hypothetical protein HBH61_188260 [Parastagonospora nodorum]|nr:hypothetical protein HBH61_188260 [Parastagonospora nodorum]KAH5328553.1 hypothetical protein HBI11_008770 [Parastagonospora nodorum]KAH5668638.1 hypothetical protein HBI21_211790 [Parastagonospora nodorum]KAH5773859.1 hypothetical protein HBI17_007550 [Parastagonospora nodorum]KAH6018342.1 hypothetical protein HBI83_119980 [Parastagonospora nodorum]
MEKPRNNERGRQRSSAACDACRARKVKCIASADQGKCSMCSELNIDCTSERPRKKRGPKNRYVQILRAHLDGDTIASDEPDKPSLDLIAPSEILDLILDDWFNCFHPIAPVLHRNSFMARIRSVHDGDVHESRSFLVLVASVCAATCASLRRRRHHYSTVTVDSCLALAERFGLWAAPESITLEKALAFYNFSSAVHLEHGIDSAIAFRLIGDSTVCIKYLMQQKLDDMSFMDQQIVKRLYWMNFAWQCTAEMHGRRLLVLHHAHEASSVPFPLPVSFEELLNGSVSPQASVGGPDYSYVSGLNALSGLFLVWQSSQAIMVQTMENLQEYILRVHQALSELPPELAWTDGANQAGDFSFNVQKVNLKVTQLHIRSNLLEQMNYLARSQGCAITPDAIIDERHRVVEELLDVLYTMPEEVFDANGYSIVSKIRDIGGALLDELRTGEHGRTLQASVALDRLLSKLENLDLNPMVHTPCF